MQLIDKDLLSMQEVRELVEAAKEAQQELARMDQAQVDRIVRAIADAGVRNARRLAQMANEDTGFGIVDDKVIKNIFASRGVYEHIKDMKTIGEISRDDAKRLRTIAVPVGVIAGLIPSTNPTSTALYKAEIAIKAGNAIVFSPPTPRPCAASWRPSRSSGRRWPRRAAMRTWSPASPSPPWRPPTTSCATATWP